MSTMSDEERNNYARYYAQRDYKAMFGKEADEPTLAQLIPIYRGTDPNIQDVSGGNAAVAKLYQAQQYQEKNDPIKLAQQQRDTLQKQAPQYYGQIQSQFKNILGRDASQAELDHFAPMFASGDADAYSIGQALQALPEYTQGQDKKAQEDLRGQLSSADQTYFQQNLMPTITSNFAQSGRMTDSSSPALAAAFAQAGTQQNSAREQYLAQIGYQNYANNRQTLVNNYLTNQGAQLANDTYAKQQQAALAQAQFTQANQVTDYGIQQSAYEQYLQAMGRRKTSNTWGSTIGTFAGAGLGAYLGGPAGATVGANLGRTAGGLFDSY